MAQNRSTLIRARVQRNLGDKFSPDEIYDAMNLCQEEILEDAPAKQASGTIAILANTELYNFPDGMISETGIFGGDTTPIVYLKNMGEVADLKRLGSISTATSTTPSYYYKLNRQFGFLNVSGVAPTTAGTVTVYFFRRRLQADATETPSETVIPIVDSRWDKCLELGTCFYLTNDPRWLNLYRPTLERMRSFEIAQTDNSYKIPSCRDYD